jgi:hypothetical protein
MNPGMKALRIEQHFPFFKLMSGLDHIDDFYRHKVLLRDFV